MAETPGLLQLLSADVVYIRLHGMENQGYLYSDPGKYTALKADQVQGRIDLFENSLIFLEGCEGVELSAAFMSAGARAVIGSSETTYGRRWKLGPSSIIGREFLRGVRKKRDPQKSLDHALTKVDPEHRAGWKVIERQV